jgi:hypothetical protein
MKYRQTKLWIGFVLLNIFAPAILAQSYCTEGNGPLDPSPLQGMTPHQVIQKVADNETVAAEASKRYSFTRDMTVQTVEGNRVDGEFREVAEITYTNQRVRTEKITFSPPSTLTRIVLSQTDLDELRNTLSYALTTENLQHYSVGYVGHQLVDEIETYVFDVSPLKKESDRLYFHGRIWVDSRGLQIIKTCGNLRAPVHAKEQNKSAESFLPLVTYRGQIDGQFLFPVYVRGDDIIHFSTGNVQIRVIIKYTNYKRSEMKP